MNDPRILPATLTAQSFLAITADEDRQLQMAHVQQQTIADQSLEHPLIDQCLFEGTTFINDNFYRAELTDVIFKNCTLVNCQLEAASLYRVQL